MKICTSEQMETCEVEKRGCEGCYYHIWEEKVKAMDSIDILNSELHILSYAMENLSKAINTTNFIFDEYSEELKKVYKDMENKQTELKTKIKEKLENKSKGGKKSG